MSNQLVVNNLAKAYKGRKIIIDVSLEVNSNQIVGLLGPNGAGKTTCFCMILGLVSCDAGSIILNGEDITHLPLHKRAQRGIGYLPQDSSIFRTLSVTDNILAILQLRKELSKAQRQDKLASLLDEFGLNHIKDSLGMSLSGGERRRVEIARTLASEPAFVLLDEPFAGVDPISVIDIKELIEKLKVKGIGVLITDHNVRETLSICDITYTVGQGKVIASGSASDILSNKIVQATYLGQNFNL
jgi:lipopolysaccharide export system ATP-binding protein